jgi:hypothetical protein
MRVSGSAAVIMVVSTVVMVVAIVTRVVHFCRGYARCLGRKEMPMHPGMRVRVDTPSMTMDRRRPGHGLSLAATAV